MIKLLFSQDQPKNPRPFNDTELLTQQTYPVIQPRRRADPAQPLAWGNSVPRSSELPHSSPPAHLRTAEQPWAGWRAERSRRPTASRPAACDAGDTLPAAVPRPRTAHYLPLLKVAASKESELFWRLLKYHYTG